MTIKESQHREAQSESKMNENNFSAGNFEFIQQDQSGRGYRLGFVIAVSDGKGGKKAWGDQVFQTEASAASTAAQCLRSSPYEILPAKEVVHFGNNPKSYRYFRSILVNDGINDSSVRWYAVRVLPGYQRMAREIEGEPEHRRGETIIERNLRNENIDVYMPAFWKEIRKHRSRRLVERRMPLLIGYAFVRRDPGDGFDPIRKIDGVAGIVQLSRENGPIAFSEQDMQKLMLSGFDTQQAYRFKRETAVEDARHKQRKHLNSELGRLLPKGRSRTVSLRFHAESCIEGLDDRLKSHVQGIIQLLDGLADDGNLDVYREAV